MTFTKVLYVMFQNLLVLTASSLYKMHLWVIMVHVVVFIILDWMWNCFDESKYHFSAGLSCRGSGQFAWEQSSSLFLTTGLLVVYCSNTGCSCYLLICLHYSCSSLGTSSLETKQCWIFISGNPLCLWLFFVHIYPNFSKLDVLFVKVFFATLVCTSIWLHWFKLVLPIYMYKYVRPWKWRH